MIFIYAVIILLYDDKVTQLVLNHYTTLYAFSPSGKNIHLTIWVRHMTLIENNSSEQNNLMFQADTVYIRLLATCVSCKFLTKNCMRACFQIYSQSGLQKTKYLDMPEWMRDWERQSVIWHPHHWTRHTNCWTLIVWSCCFMPQSAICQQYHGGL